MGYKSNIHSVFLLKASFTKKEKTKSHTGLGLYANGRDQEPTHCVCSSPPFASRKGSFLPWSPVLADSLKCVWLSVVNYL